MGRPSRTLGKNNWVLFVIILLGIVVGSFLGQLATKIEVLKWLNSGIDFALGDAEGSNVVTLDLGVFVVHFGFMLKITIGSVIGAIASVFIYKRI